MDFKLSRWQQRFQNFQKAMDSLREALDALEQDPESRIIRAAVIKNYELSFELGWKTMKDYLESKGLDLIGSKDTMKQAFKEGLITNGTIWIKTIESRNQMVHVYQAELAKTMALQIQNSYRPMLENLETIFRSHVDTN